jgi:hypothetical protein
MNDPTSAEEDLADAERVLAGDARAFEGIVCRWQGPLINIGVGIALTIFLWFLVGPKVALCGLIPGLVGVAMMVYVFYMAAPVE